MEGTLFQISSRCLQKMSVSGYLTTAKFCHKSCAKAVAVARRSLVKNQPFLQIHWILFQVKTFLFLISVPELLHCLLFLSVSSTEEWMWTFTLRVPCGATWAGGSMEEGTPWTWSWKWEKEDVKKGHTFKLRLRGQVFCPKVFCPGIWEDVWEPVQAVQLL